MSNLRLAGLAFAATMIAASSAEAQEIPEPPVAEAGDGSEVDDRAQSIEDRLRAELNPREVESIVEVATGRVRFETEEGIVTVGYLNPGDESVTARTMTSEGFQTREATDEEVALFDRALSNFDSTANPRYYIHEEDRTARVEITPSQKVTLSDGTIVYSGGYYTDWSNCFPNVYFPDEGIMIGYLRSASREVPDNMLYDQPLVWDVSLYDMERHNRSIDDVMTYGPAETHPTGLDLRRGSSMLADDRQRARYESALRDSGLVDVIPTPDVVQAARDLADADALVEQTRDALMDALLLQQTAEMRYERAVENSERSGQPQQAE